MIRTAPTPCAARAPHPIDAAIDARHVDLYDRPLTRAGAGKAHKARGTYEPRTAEGIAAFLAATERH